MNEETCWNCIGVRYSLVTDIAFCGWIPNCGKSIYDDSRAREYAKGCGGYKEKDTHG